MVSPSFYTRRGKRADVDGGVESDLEPELHEGDGAVAWWIWIAVAAVVASAALLAPFQLYWPAGR